MKDETGVLLVSHTYHEETEQCAIFAQKLRSKKALLPEDLADGLDLTLNAVTDLLRVSRNEAGHPTERDIARDDCFIHLRMFVGYVRKLYSLKTSLQNAAEA